MGVWLRRWRPRLAVRRRVDGARVVEVEVFGSPAGRVVVRRWLGGRVAFYKNCPF